MITVRRIFRIKVLSIFIIRPILSFGKGFANIFFYLAAFHHFTQKAAGKPGRMIFCGNVKIGAGVKITKKRAKNEKYYAIFFKKIAGVERAEPFPRHSPSVLPKLSTAVLPKMKGAQHPKNTQKRLFRQPERPLAAHLHSSPFTAAKRQFPRPPGGFRLKNRLPVSKFLNF